MSHELSHSLQSAGCPNVPVSCHSCDSLLHWIVAWQTTSSEPHFEHTGVERAARPVRSSTVRGTSGIKLNGLMSAVRRICFIPLDLVFGPKPTPAIARWPIRASASLEDGMELPLFISAPVVR
jgi:hypothetical protein